MATKTDLVKNVSEAVGITKTDTLTVVNSIFSELGNLLISDGVVQIADFGKFLAKVTPQRNGRNPRTGEAIVIPAKTRVRFNPPGDELEQYGIKKTRRREAYKIIKTHRTLDREKIDYGVAAVGAPNAWKETRGEGVTVMILDTGISPKHPDLKFNIIKAFNFTDSRTPWDRDGHGTFCAGLVAGIDNGKGIIGVAPRAKIISGKVLDDYGYGYDSRIAKGIRWAIRNKKKYGIEILSLSLGGDSYEPVLKRAFIAAKKAGLILVCAAGNEASPESQEQDIDTIGYPARFASEGLSISVGAIDPNMNLADFSSTGPELLFVAPGVDVTSTWPKTSYATLSGTSFSTPIIAGVCALAIAKHRKYGGATPINGLDDMVEHLKKISHDLGIAGKDHWFGYGIPKL